MTAESYFRHHCCQITSKPASAPLMPLSAVCRSSHVGMGCNRDNLIHPSSGRFPVAHFVKQSLVLPSPKTLAVVVSLGT